MACPKQSPFKVIGRFVAILLALGSSLASSALGDPLEVGSMVPDVRFIDADGEPRSPSDLLGDHRALVLAWFPKAFTPG